MKKIYLILLGLILGVVLFGCKSKQVVTKNESLTKSDTLEVFRDVHDTVYVDRVIEKTKPVYFETEIPCDSNQVGKIRSGNNFTEYRVKDGRIQLRTNIDSVTNYWQSYYHAKHIRDSTNTVRELEHKFSATSKTKVYVYPWWIYAIIAGVILFIVAWVYIKFFTPL